jgi:hypothetical protein
MKTKRKEEEEKEIYVELQKQWVKLNDLKVGDEVKVISKAEDLQMGWGTYWVDTMDDYILSTCEVSGISEHFGLKLNYRWFPFFVLQKVEKKPMIVKPLTEILRIEALAGSLLLDCNGKWFTRGTSYNLKSEMAEFCGKEPDSKYRWNPEWLEEVK